MVKELNNPTKSSFDWKCPACGQVQTEYFDIGLGPHFEVLCENCDGYFDIETLKEYRGKYENKN